jgi:hypothetical protein
MFIAGDGRPPSANRTGCPVMRPAEVRDRHRQSALQCLRRHFHREVNGHKYSIFIMVVFVPCGLVPIGIKPYTYCSHRSRKLSGAYPDLDAAHDISPILL